MLREWSEAQAKVAFGTEEQAIFNTSSDASPTLQFEVYRPLKIHCEACVQIIHHERPSQVRYGVKLIEP